MSVKDRFVFVLSELGCDCLMKLLNLIMWPNKCEKLNIICFFANLNGTSGKNCNSVGRLNKVGGMSVCVCVSVLGPEI